MLHKRWFTLRLQRLDNEVSKILQEFMEEQGVIFQLTPAGLRRRNNAKQAIQTFNNHFIVGLSSSPPHFPLNLWEKLLPQALLTLNLIISAQVNPQLSSYAHVHSACDMDFVDLVFYLRSCYVGFKYILAECSRV